MAIEVVMPQLGLAMDSGKIISWLKQSGDHVETGDILLEVESDKASVEVEAVESGILQIVRSAEDGSIPVGDVIAYLLREGEKPPQEPGGETLPAVKTTQIIQQSTPTERITHEVSTLPAGKPGTGNGRREPSSPAARRRAKELGIDWRMAEPTGPGGAILERDVVLLASNNSKGSLAVAETSIEIQISPVAQRFAAATGISAAELAQRFPGKRVEREDVELFIQETLQKARRTPASETRYTTEKAPLRREAIGRLRQIIAERMSLSAHTYAPVTLTTEVDASELVRIREKLKVVNQTDIVPSYNALLLRITAEVLTEFPDLNATLEAGEIIYWNSVNIGVAVETERGLVVPVIRNAAHKSAREIELEMADILPRAKDGKALPDELSGGTFTITNLGVYEIDGFTPIINPPESAVLGVGRLVKKWVVLEDQAIIRTMLSLSLTFDHRLIDGAPAARCLQRIKQYIEEPYLWLV